ncbi:MAG TPA: Rrf2 family transcriptional regulator [Streptosporangiaceae bacterium]|nr:Rrf2 family transcriptional regulator [Streptosporangiaceae bacterium]
MIMKLPEGVEWALHCTWLLALARDDDALPARRLAEFYDLPEAYLAKLLKTLVRAGLLTAATGPRGGFRIARPPEEITVADVVEAVEGPGALFHCMEIRQRGPVPLAGDACRTPCGIARVMHRAERAWRQELAATTIADLLETSGPAAVTRVSTWLATIPGAARPRPAAAVPAARQAGRKA